MKELAEILKRIAEIEKEVRAGNVSEDLEKELDTLLAKKKDIEDRQKAIEKKFEEAKTIFPAVEEKSSVDFLTKMSKRDKLAYIIGKQVRKKTFSDAEKRALGSVLTTTASTFVEASASVDGVNNAGVFIPTELVMDLLREEGKLSPILSDIIITSIPGLAEYPYRKSRDKARPKAEGADGKQNQMEWTKLSLSKGYLQTVIAVTDEVRALTDFDLGAYIVEQMLQDISEDWCGEIIYGTGTDDRIKGITVGATAAVTGGYANGAVVDAIVAGIKKCKGKFRRGAKIYAAQDVYDELLFSTDDNGNFRYPIFNSTGIQSIGMIRLELDENLNEGEFLIGNVSKYFKINSLIPLRMESDRQARKGITEYIASLYCASAPLEGAFVHGTKRS